MLSFLREQGFEDSLENNTTSANGDDVKNQYKKSPKPEDQQYLTVAAQGKNVRKMTIMLAVLFVIGLLGLLFMIKKSVPQTATAASVNTEETQIQKAIERLTGVGSEMFKRMDQIVKKFYEFSDVSQVGVYELVKNPFERQIFVADTDEDSDSKEAELMRQQMLNRGKKDLQLLTILKTDQGYCCMIDDKILYEGDVIKGFKVCRINEASVKLELEGREIVLKLSEL
jgi:preprotein translocase subunit SecG